MTLTESLPTSLRPLHLPVTLVMLGNPSHSGFRKVCCKWYPRVSVDHLETPLVETEPPDKAFQALQECLVSVTALRANSNQLGIRGVSPRLKQSEIVR